ncbi:MAG: hypothetical protein HETSPECPRED_007942 [Heterodermia speciosa]|uniref:Major facilitator superfamily (MFS) profile domain-containing protein n=1 Tax=Heterodermia speciosa TaxID=116794 RepID=A0A8H3I973_9LECA|nr:MAG: hypothetical protein HETSPECPRED_007942 [Heterodermia speciosa]
MPTGELVGVEQKSTALGPFPESKHEILPGNTADDEDETSPFSVFTPAEKRSIACLASFSAIFSTISSFIYFPAVTALSNSLHVSIGAINLTITSYFIVAGIAPSIMGDMADQSGRRPVSLLAFTLYLGATLGLAAQDSYAALQTLRCLQSAGASGTVAIAYGVISDIAPSAERGSYVGLLLGLANAAPSLGPVLGGVIAEKLSWRWIFWILAITSGLHLLLLFVFLPETARIVVGNGSRSPRSIIYQSLYHRLCRSRYDQNEGRIPEKPPFHLPNPFSSLITLLQRCTFIVILVGSLQSSLFNSIATSLSSQMIHIYSLTYLTAGLSYLPSGLGGAIAAYFTGKLLDRDYRMTSKNHPGPADISIDNVSSFPIEKARLRSIFIFIAINTVATAGYGWALASRTHIAVPLIMLFFTGSSSAATFVACGTLITDLNPNRSSTVQASYNLTRCLMNAAAIAALQPMIDSVGVGWCFTIFAAIGALCVPSLLLLRSRGLAWRLGKVDQQMT